MELVVDELTPRKPQQARSRQTVKLILQHAERLLQEAGPQKFSMPALAQRANVNRASVYKYFPTKFAVFNSLAQTYVDAFIAELTARMESTRHSNWQAALEEVIRFSAEIYNRNPVARVLFLSGALTPEIEAAHHVSNNLRVSAFLREIFETRHQVAQVPTDPDPYLVATEAVIATFSLSQRRESRISPAMTTEAYRVGSAYLGGYLD